MLVLYALGRRPKCCTWSLALSGLVDYLGAFGDSYCKRHLVAYNISVLQALGRYWETWSARPLTTILSFFHATMVSGSLGVGACGPILELLLGCLSVRAFE